MSGNSARERALALIEVSIAFAIMHVAFRAFKRFTELGQLEYQHGVNYSAGIAMVLVAAAMILLGRRRVAEHGITQRDLGRHANEGLVAALVWACVGGVAVACGLRRDPSWASPVNAGAIAGLNVLVAVMVLGILWFGRAGIAPVPKTVGLACAVAIPLVPLAGAAVGGRDIANAALDSLGAVVISPVAESIFFFGYTQGRLNAVFGRPWRVLGTDFGAGLVIAAVAFGLVHVLNTYDYFRGEGHPSLWAGLGTASTVFYGLLRERTGTIVAPAVMHAFINAAGRMV